MTIGILQPGYLPWLGFFEQMYRSDVFVVYDDVQYDKHGWRNRNKIKTSKGPLWLTVPVKVSFKNKLLINEVKISNKTNWRKKHLLSINQNYAKAPFYREYIGMFEDFFSRSWENLIDVDMHFIVKLAECLRMGQKRIVKSSELGLSGNRIGKLINICKYFNADIFYEGSSGRNYIDEDIFLKSRIKVEFQDYKHPVYNQLYADFLPNLSVVDLLFNHGRESLSILLNQSREESRL